jgi:hypothetical protein
LMSVACVGRLRLTGSKHAVRRNNRLCQVEACVPRCMGHVVQKPTMTPTERGVRRKSNVAVAHRPLHALHIRKRKKKRGRHSTRRRRPFSRIQCGENLVSDEFMPFWRSNRLSKGVWRMSLLAKASFGDKFLKVDKQQGEMYGETWTEIAVWMPRSLIAPSLQRVYNTWKERVNSRPSPRSEVNRRGARNRPRGSVGSGNRGATPRRT